MNVLTNGSASLSHPPPHHHHHQSPRGEGANYEASSTSDLFLSFQFANVSVTAETIILGCFQMDFWPCLTPPTVLFNNIPVQHSTFQKHLGVYLDETINFNQRCQGPCQSCRQISRIKKSARRALKSPRYSSDHSLSFFLLFNFGINYHNLKHMVRNQTV